MELTSTRRPLVFRYQGFLKTIEVEFRLLLAKVALFLRNQMESGILELTKVRSWVRRVGSFVSFGCGWTPHRPKTANKCNNCQFDSLGEISDERTAIEIITY